MEIVEEVDHQQAVTTLILGIIGLVLCQLCGPIALYMGQKYRKSCQLAGVEPEITGTIGWVLGIIGTIYFVLVMLFLLLYIGFFFVFFGLALIAG